MALFKVMQKGTKCSIKPSAPSLGGKRLRMRKNSQSPGNLKLWKDSTYLGTNISNLQTWQTGKPHKLAWLQFLGRAEEIASNKAINPRTGVHLMLTLSAGHLLVSASNLTKSASFVKILHLKSQCDFSTLLLFNVSINSLKVKAELLNHASNMATGRGGQGLDRAELWNIVPCAGPAHTKWISKCQVWSWVCWKTACRQQVINSVRIK